MSETLRCKDIILVPFPFSDLTSQKRRPALIISSDLHNSKSQDVIACGITSFNSGAANTIQIDKSEWLDGLYSESYVRVDKVVTL
ncbi:MAG TPA: type II toxin-antitoxin system PemK/MazF family toxin, partial [Candidatus Micrarchaeota archaeon]|nr:type II toxin-antitoxin system PemK/MazF family toxin [Candidatus Micrarchaeota archaeon]